MNKQLHPQYPLLLHPVSPLAQARHVTGPRRTPPPPLQQTCLVVPRRPILA